MIASQETVRVNGVDLCVREAGSGRPTLLFLHYWGGSSGTWSETMDRLAGSYRCIAPDFRGWGASSAGPDGYGLDALTDDILALIRQLALTDFIIVGHSMGGKVAQIVASERPEGLIGLVLIAPAPPMPLAVPPDMRAWVRANLDTREGLETILPQLANVGLRGEQREALIATTLAGAPGAKDSWVNEGMDYDLTSRTSQVEVPICVVIGGADGIEPEASLRDAFGKYYPDAYFRLIPAAGHLIPLEAPSELVGFISEAAVRFSQH